MRIATSSQSMIEQKLAADHFSKQGFSDQRLEILFANLAAEYKKKDPKLDLYQAIARYGLRTPDDVSAFLKSPRGKAILAMIEIEKAEIEALEEKAQQQAEHNRFLNSVALLLLALTYWYKQELIKEAQQEAEQELQHHKELNKHHKEEAQQHDESRPIPSEILYDMERELSDLYLKKLQEITFLDSLTERLTHEEQNMRSRHQQLDSLIDETYDFLAVAKPEEIKTRIEKIKKQIIIQNQQFSEEVTDNTQGMSNPKQQLYPVGNQANLFQPQSVLQDRMHLQLQLQSLQDHLKVLNNKKAYFDVHGEPTSTPREAAYIVPKGSQLVKDHNNRVTLVSSATNQSKPGHQQQKNIDQVYTVKHSTLLQHTAEQQDFNARFTNHMIQTKEAKQQAAILAPASEELKHDLQERSQANLQGALQPTPSLSSPKMAPPACSVNLSKPTITTAATVTAKANNQYNEQMHELTTKQPEHHSPEPSPNWPPKPVPPVA